MPNKPRKPSDEPYTSALLSLWASGVLKPGQAYVAQIAHDAWCDLLNERGPCTCNPDIHLTAAEDSTAKENEP